MNKDIIEKLLNDGVGVLPTDTLYGLVGRALSEKAAGKISKLKRRREKSPFIILISEINDLYLFDIKINGSTRNILEKYWPGKVSIILPCDSEKFYYLHMGTKSLAFRVPDKEDLRDLLKKNGPLIAPSANHPGEKEALTIAEAKAYFGDSVDFYIDGGRIESLPSTLIKIENGEVVVLRKGVVEID